MIRLCRSLATAIVFMLISLLIVQGADAQVFSFKWGSPGGIAGNLDGQFDEPVGIAIDSQGNVYVSDQNNNRVQKFSATGTFLGKFGSGGIDPGQFSAPQGIAIDSLDNVYVADWGNNRVQKFDSGGGFITQWGTPGSDDGNFSNPHGIAIDSADFVFVTDFFNNRVQKFNSAGTFITKWGVAGSLDGQFTNPRAVAVDSLDNIYVSDANSRIQKFDSVGNFLFTWGTRGSGDGQLIDPMGIAIDSSGNVFVTENVNCRLQEFDNNGAFVTKWGIFGFKDGQFRWPYGVAVDPAGKVYVVDSDKNEVQVFTPPLAPAGNGTGTWNYSMTNIRVIEEVGVVCLPEPNRTGTATVTQTGQAIRIVTSDGDDLTGFVSGPNINASSTTPDLEFGGFDSSEILGTIPSNAGGSGILRFSWQDTFGAYCTGEADLSLTAQTNPSVPVSGGGGGGGCFVGAAFN